MAGLTVQAQGGHWRSLQTIDLIFGDDMFRKKEQLEALKCIDDWCPDLVVITPPCHPWSSLQNLNDPAAVAKLRAMHRVFFEFLKKAWTKQCLYNALALSEQPQAAASLQLDEMLSRPSVCRVLVNQCAYGLSDPVSRKPYHKATAIDVNNKDFAENLEKSKKVCKWTREQHEVIQGTVMVQGESTARSAVASKWTDSFCTWILNAARKTLEDKAAAVVNLALHEEVPADLQDAFIAVFDDTFDSYVADDDAGIDVEIRKKFKQLSQEEAERRGDVSGIGARYGYISFGGPGLLVNRASRNVIAKPHGN